jgi:hypothetical protein
MIREKTPDPLNARQLNECTAIGTWASSFPYLNLF